MKVFKSKKHLLEEAMKDETMLDKHVGTLQHEGIRYEIWLRKCLCCEKLFPAKGKYIRLCPPCRGREGIRRDYKE
jgi:hypothetical protein